MGNASSFADLEKGDIDKIQRETGFTSNQIKKLYKRFIHLDKRKCGRLCKDDLLCIPELSINPMLDRIMNAAFEESDCDGISFIQFIHFLARFLPINEASDNPLNSLEDKMKFAFKIFDLNDDGFISQDEVHEVLHMMVGSNLSEEQMTKIAERIIRQSDENEDENVSFEEFCKTLEGANVEKKMTIKFLE